MMKPEFVRTFSFVPVFRRFISTGNNHRLRFGFPRSRTFFARSSVDRFIHSPFGTNPVKKVSHECDARLTYDHPKSKPERRSCDGLFLLVRRNTEWGSSSFVALAAWRSIGRRMFPQCHRSTEPRECDFVAVGDPTESFIVDIPVQPTAETEN
jgi:hypothetical protein